MKPDNDTLISLLFHEVSDINFSSGFQTRTNISYTHSLAEFEKMMREMKSHELLTEKLVDEFSFEDFSKSSLVTFDDGGSSALNSADILTKLGGRGHFFITTNFIGQKGFLTSDEIKHLDENGHLIGSHSHTHPMIFRSLPYQKMKEEWQVSKNILEEILGKEILACSIPGGDADAKTYESAIDAGYRFVFNSEPTSKIIMQNDAYILGRFSIEKQTSLNTFKDILTGKNHRSLQNKRLLKNSLKKIIFPIHLFIQNRKKL